MIVDKDDYLEHYGVKGMKWGVRRSSKQLGHKINKHAKKIRKGFSTKEGREKIAVKSLNFGVDFFNEYYKKKFINNFLGNPISSMPSTKKTLGKNAADAVLLTKWAVKYKSLFKP